MTARRNVLRWHRYRSHGITPPGLHFAYCLVVKDEKSWRHIRGLFFATRRHSYWLSMEHR